MLCAFQWLFYIWSNFVTFEMLSFTADSTCARLLTSFCRLRTLHKSCPRIKAVSKSQGRTPPLEAILVIFGRRALIFLFCLKGLGKKWKMTPLLCTCAVVIILETQKCRKRAPRSVEFNFLLIALDTNGFRRMKEKGQIYKMLPQIF